LSQRIRARAAASLAVLAVTAGGVTALTTAAHASTAVANGPIAYNDGTHWSEVNADSSRRHTITPSGGGFPSSSAISDVAFSRDGSWAAFSVTPPNGTGGGALWISWADGTHARQIVPATPRGVGGDQPVWSADSKTIIFVSHSTQAGLAELMTVPSDGSAAPTPLLTNPDSPYGDDEASVAPNGDIAFTAHISSSTREVHIIDPVTKAVKHTIWNFQSARFSPDGTKLVAFGQPANLPNGPYLMAADGSGKQLLTSKDPGGCGDGEISRGGLTWSPDGSQIAFPSCAESPAGSGKMAITVYTQPATPGAAMTAVMTQDNAPSPQPFIDWGAPFTPPTSQNPGRPYTLRLGGGDRIATAIAVADNAYGPAAKTKAKVAVLSRSDNYADALAGNALAAQKGGPLLLTAGAKLDPTVGAELGKLLPKGATVYVLGGDQALSPQIEAGILALGLTPKRLAGSDRFQTATRIAAEISPHPHTVMVATGVNAPDALAAGAAAATDPNGGVVLLSDGKVLPAVTRAYLAGVNPSTTAVYGVGVQGVTALDTVPGFAAHFTKLAGADRYATDAAVANNATLYPNPAQAALATGGTWPDALSGGAYAGTLHAPLLLTDGAAVPSGAGLWLHAHGPALTFVPVFGGPNAVPDGAVKQAGAQAWGAGGFDMK
jgi:Tol biopolymer transport system component